jgi:hypothetical protein
MSAMPDLSRVPYFAFVDKEHGINAEASKEKGYEVPALMTFIQVTPHGHRGDPMEFFADEFIVRKATEAKNGSYDPRWVAAFKEGLEAHREGKELPREGTPLVLWERILKTRREQLAHQFPTVEDLAATPDSSLGDIGLDGRVLRDMARGDIKAKTDLSPVVKELAIANETIRRQHDQIEKLAKRLDAIELLGDGQGKREKVKA